MTMATTPITVTLPDDVMRFLNSRQHNPRERSLIVTRFLQRYEVIAAYYHEPLSKLFTPEEWSFLIQAIAASGYTTWHITAMMGFRSVLTERFQRLPKGSSEKKKADSIVGKLDALSLPELLILSELFDESLRRVGLSTMRIGEEDPPLQKRNKPSSKAHALKINKPSSRSYQTKK
jgi:hypothetical protein